MNDLEARQLRYYVAVAEELHFGRAAQRLGMAQPPLSRAIRTLERQLGVQLLERTTRQVRLTPAGEVLLRDARIALDAISAAGERARHTGQPVPSLRVALKADYDAGLLPRMLEVFRESPAALRVELLLGGRGDQVIALREGRADVALLPSGFDLRGLDVEPLLTEPSLLALAADDPLAVRAELHLADLAGRVLPDGKPADGGGLSIAAGDVPDQWPSTNSPTQAFDPAPRPLDLAQIFNLIELGSIVWFPPASLARRHPRPDIVYRSVVDLPPTTLSVAWPQLSHSPAVAAFVRAAMTVAQAAVAAKSESGVSAGQVLP
jgi:DNA-binding transcriptional LysR family regulator